MYCAIMDNNCTQHSRCNDSAGCYTRTLGCFAQGSGMLRRTPKFQRYQYSRFPTLRIQGSEFEKGSYDTISL